MKRHKDLGTSEDHWQGREITGNGGNNPKLLLLLLLLCVLSGKYGVIIC